MVHEFVRLHNQRRLLKNPIFYTKQLFHSSQEGNLLIFIDPQKKRWQMTTEGRIKTQKETKNNDSSLNLYTVHFNQINIQESIS